MKKVLLILVPLFILGTLLAAPLNEGFESPTCPPSEWTIRYANPNPPSGNLMTHSTTYYHSGSRSFRFSSYTSGAPYDQYLITPQLLVTEGDQTVSFWYRSYSSYGSEVFRVGWSSTGTEITNFTWSSDITNASTSWQQYSKTDLPVGTKYVAVHYKSNYQYYLYIDDFVGPEVYVSGPPNPAVLVYPPNNSYAFLDATLILTWQSGGGSPTGYDVYLDTVDGSTKVKDHTEQTTTTYTPTNLQAGTTYFWKVVPWNNNGPAENCPVWSFKTPTTTQLTESFEGTSFPPAGWSNPGSWSRYTTYAKHGTASAYKYGATTTQYILSSPKVTITSTSTLDFWALCSTTTGTLQIVYSPDRTTWTQIGSITFAATYTWYHYVIDLSGLAGNNFYLGFRTGLQSASFYVDCVFGPEITPEVPGPVTLTSPSDLATGVNEFTTFTWTAPTTGGVPTGYKLYCDTNNPPTTLKADINALTYTLTTPLAYNTTYYWTVLAYNGAGNGPTATVRSFTTRTDPTISTFPWVEDFGTTTNFPPLNWTRLVGLYPSETPTSTTSGWTYDDFANVVTTPPNMSARLNIWSTSTKYWLVTPPIAIPSAGYELKFDLALTTFSGIATPPTPGNQADDRFIVLISDNPLMTNPTVLREWNNTGSSYVYDNISPSGENQIISLNAYSGTKYIAFYGESTVSGGDNNIYVDNVTVRETPAAPIINCTPSSWDFGQTLINTTKTKDFTISNTGGGTLSISSITIAGDYYTLLTNPAPVDLTTGQTATFTVKYAPTAVGTHNGTVTITDNRGTTDVTLIGQCYDPTITAAQLPYTNSFEDTWVGTPPAPGLGWTVINANNDYYTWRRGPTYITAHTGSYIAQGMGNTNDWLITPPIQASIDLRIKWWDKVESASYPNTYSVLVSTTDNNIASFTNNLGTFTCTNTVWTQHTLNLDAFTGNTIYVAFHQTASASTYYDFGIDDFLLEEIPQQPVFNYSPTSINFGEVVQGVQVGPRYVTVTNIGGGTLILSPSAITIINDAGHNFSFDFENEVELSTGMSVNIPVYVTVHSEGPVSAILRINYADTDYDVALSATGLPTGIVVIGTGTEDLALPIDPFYGYSYSQSIFLQSDIQVTNRYIEKIYYYWNGAASAENSNDWTIYMGNTDLTEFADENSWVTGLTQVFSGIVELPNVPGWVEITLDQPFFHTNQNLIIAVDENTDSYDGDSEFFYCTSTGAKGYRSILYYDDYTNPAPANPPTANNTITGFPNLKLQFQEEQPPLPVELTSFTAVISSDNLVEISWVTQTETGMVGYYIYRSTSETLDNAIAVSDMIEALNTAEQHTYKFIDSEIYDSGTYYYWLQTVEMGGTVSFHGPVSVYYTSAQDNPIPEIPKVTELRSIYPNPFNPVAYIPYSLAEESDAHFYIYNVKGQLLRHIYVGPKNPGYYQISWDGKDINGKACGSGVYYIIMKAGKQTFQRKAVLMK